MKRSSVPLKNRGGFTLIEILLTAMIVAFLAGSLYATFTAGFKLDSRAKKSFLGLDQQRLFFEQLNKDFGRAVCYDFRGSLADRKSFSSNGKELIFLIEDHEELKWIRYALVVAEKTHIKETKLGVVTKVNVAVSNVTATSSNVFNLVRDENDFNHFFDSDTLPQKRDVLLKNVFEDGCKVFFSEIFSGQPNIEWQSNWDKDFLPYAVRIKISMVSDSAVKKTFSRYFILPSGGRDEP